jgi:type I restriction enzyme M protein
VISENDYNMLFRLSGTEDTREVIDIKVLNAQLQKTVKRQDALRKAIDDKLMI